METPCRFRQENVVIILVTLAKSTANEAPNRHLSPSSPATSARHRSCCIRFPASSIPEPLDRFCRHARTRQELKETCARVAILLQNLGTTSAKLPSALQTRCHRGLPVADAVKLCTAKADVSRRWRIPPLMDDSPLETAGGTALRTP